MLGPQEIAIMPHGSTLDSWKNIVTATVSNVGDCYASAFKVINDKGRTGNHVLKRAMKEERGGYSTQYTPRTNKTCSVSE